MLNVRHVGLIRGVLVAVGLIPLCSQAQTIDHSGGFASHGDLTPNGHATFVRSLAQLTKTFGEAGSIFSNSAEDIRSFENTFTFKLLPNAAFFKGDGITFTLQGNSPTAVGAGGGGLGYLGIPNSVAIKFDLWNNEGEGIDSTGLYTNGAPPTVPAINLTGIGIDLHSNHVFGVDMTYNGSLLDVKITDTATMASASQFYPIDISSFVGGDTEFVGFTGATGAQRAIQDIETWKFTSSVSAVPEPGSLTLLGIGALSLLGHAKLRRRWVAT
jgi:hypothetical protein